MFKQPLISKHAQTETITYNTVFFMLWPKILWHSGMRSFKGIISEIGDRWNTFLTKCRIHMKIRKLLSKIPMKALQKYIQLGN